MRCLPQHQRLLSALIRHSWPLPTDICEVHPWQVDDEHARLASHAVAPGQQASPALPQALQVLLPHADHVSQVLPAQQGSFFAPQWVQEDD